MSSSAAPVFDLSAGNLCLDFVNTWSDRARPETDLLQRYDDLLAFLAQAGAVDGERLAVRSAAARRQPAGATAELARARELREALYAVLSSRAAGRPSRSPDLERINAELPGALVAPRLEPAGTGFSWRWQEGSGLSGALAAVVRSAAELLTGEDLSRVRECPGEACTWLFLDRSRNRSRRWCSMETCGNRAKARRHYRRHGAR